MAKTAQKKTVTSLAREKLEGRIVGGRFSDLANYSDLFDRSNEAILLIDTRNYEVLESNAAVNELLRIDHSLVGTRFPLCFDDAAEVEVSEWLARNQGERPAAPIEVHSNEERLIELSCAKVRLADYCEVLQLIARDVTEERMKSKRLERESLTDEMTGLSNFRSFRSRLLLEHERAVKKNQTYSVLFFDVDHFKHFNDRNGHPAGDDALRRIAKVLRECSSRTEFVARYGGEEFVILCSNTSKDQAYRFAEKVRAAIESEKFTHGEAQPMGKVTVSVGVSTFSGNTSADLILKNADSALYESKRAGRNRVTNFSDIEGMLEKDSPHPIKLKA
jgi:diguanylate cyclase (GGDEF)-like protein